MSGVFSAKPSGRMGFCGNFKKMASVDGETFE
jgi:hypothetical protein